MQIRALLDFLLTFAENLAFLLGMVKTIKDCFSVFVHANLDWRINRIAQKYNKNAKEAKDMINKTDKSRSSYYNYYTNKKWGSADSYNLCLDSSKLGIDGTARAIIEAIHIYDSLKK